MQELKVDRSFLAGITHSRQDFDLLCGIVQLGRSLGLSLVLEGAETAAQIHLLRGLGDVQIQGFYFSRAVTQEMALSLLRAQPWRRP